MDDDKWVNQEGRLSENELGLLLQKEGGECDDRYSSQVLFAYRLLILFRDRVYLLKYRRAASRTTLSQSLIVVIT